jgi:hypothetical protein
LADIEAQPDGSGNFVNVLAAGTGSANKSHCKFGIWNEYGQNAISRIARNGVAASEENSGERPARAAENDKAQLIRNPTSRLLRLLSKSQNPV